MTFKWIIIRFKCMKAALAVLWLRVAGEQSRRPPRRETVESVTGFIFLGSKITADGDCSHEIKRHLFLEREAMTNLDSILKCRDITLPTKIHIVKSMAFSVVMYGCDCRTIKKAEC